MEKEDYELSKLEVWQLVVGVITLFVGVYTSWLGFDAYMICSKTPELIPFQPGVTNRFGDVILSVGSLIGGLSGIVLCIVGILFVVYSKKKITVTTCFIMEVLLWICLASAFFGDFCFALYIYYLAYNMLPWFIVILWETICLAFAVHMHWLLKKKSSTLPIRVCVGIISVVYIVKFVISVRYY